MPCEEKSVVNIHGVEIGVCSDPVMLYDLIGVKCSPDMEEKPVYEKVKFNIEYKKPILSVSEVNSSKITAICEEDVLDVQYETVG